MILRKTAYYTYVENGWNGIWKYLDVIKSRWSKNRMVLNPIPWKSEWIYVILMMKFPLHKLVYDNTNIWKYVSDEIIWA